MPIVDQRLFFEKLQLQFQKTHPFCYYQKIKSLILFFPDSFIDDQFQLFTEDDTDTDGMTDCGPHISFDEQDIADVKAAMAEENSRNPICNYEWVDYIDEVINALHGVSDLPVALQVVFLFFVFFL